MKGILPFGVLDRMPTNEAPAFRDSSNQIRIFRPRKHAARLAHSASYVSMPSPPEDHFVRCIHLAVSHNAANVPPHDSPAFLYIRPLLFGSGPQLGLSPPSQFTFCVYVQPMDAYLGINPLDAVIVENFDRAAPKGVGSAKIGGNYAPVMRWSERAKYQGYGITLHLDSKTGSEIDEFSSSAFAAIKTNPSGYTTLVVSASRSAIESVTCDCCMAIARSLGWQVEKRPVRHFLPL